MHVGRIGMVIVLAAAVAATTATAFAERQWPGYYSEQGSERDRGTIGGEIAGIDFGAGAIIVFSGRRERFVIAVLPSTSIFRRREELGFSDLTVGMRVEVSVSEIGHRLVAQIIRIQ